MAYILLRVVGGGRGAEYQFCPRDINMIALKHVLVATDFGDAAVAALAYGRELARTFGATLHVVTVVDDVASRAVAVAEFPAYVASLNSLQIDAEQRATAELNKLLSDEDRQRLRAKAVVIKGTRPAPAILAYAREAGVDLIVAGTHGRGAVGHVLMGSVAERLVRGAPCPVLTVRHPEHEFVRPDALQAVAHA